MYKNDQLENEESNVQLVTIFPWLLFTFSLLPECPKLSLYPVLWTIWPTWSSFLGQYLTLVKTHIKTIFWWQCRTVIKCELSNGNISWKLLQETLFVSFLVLIVCKSYYVIMIIFCRIYSRAAKTKYFKPRIVLFHFSSDHAVWVSFTIIIPIRDTLTNELFA